jgi:hypothetical protein
MKKGAIILFVLFCGLIHGQVNLVPNPGFEVYSNCPNTSSQITYAVPWNTPTLGTPDYFNVCGSAGFMIPSNAWGSQAAKSGSAYAGFYALIPAFTNGREYIQVQLSDSMVTGHNYGISLFLNFADNSNTAVSNFGCYFSKTAPNNSTGYILNDTPQVKNPIGNYIIDKINWVEIAGSFLAKGGEKYITIGVFDDDQHLDTITVNPNFGKEYYYYIDDINIIDSTALGIEGINTTGFNLYPNPVNGIFSIETQGQNKGYLRISDITGRDLISQPLSVERQNIDVSFLEKGTYFLSLFDENKNRVSTRKFLKE